MSRLKKNFEDKIVPELMIDGGYKTKIQVPKLSKIVLNMGVGEAVQNSKVMEKVVYSMTRVSGQKPVVTKAKKSISNFKLREGSPIGCMVTLRGNRMYDFLDRLINVALPRVRDFRGLPNRGFDGQGNYTVGLQEQTIFPEVNLDQLDKDRGFNITFVTTAKSNDEGRTLLTKLGLPFRN